MFIPLWLVLVDDSAYLIGQRTRPFVRIKTVVLLDFSLCGLKEPHIEPEIGKLRVINLMNRIIRTGKRLGSNGKNMSIISILNSNHGWIINDHATPCRLGNRIAQLVVNAAFILVKLHFPLKSFHTISQQSIRIYVSIRHVFTDNRCHSAIERAGPLVWFKTITLPDLIVREISIHQHGCLLLIKYDGYSTYQYTV